MSEQPKESICVCVCTHKRPALLQRTLEGLACQQTAQRFCYSIVVADNDRAESARQLVRKFRESCPVDILYGVEPEQSIAKARNRALQMSTGDYVAFIDDDEFPAPDWLLKLYHFCHKSGADGVLGPVKPFFDQTPPRWLIRGRFCERQEHPTGWKLDWRQTRTGNVLFKRELVRNLVEPFRLEFGAGGEDQDFFRRMILQGRQFLWCNEAVVFEVVPPQRWRRTYMLKRALRRGQNEKHLLSLSSIGKSLVAVPCYATVAPLLFLVRHDVFMKCLIRLFDHAGKLLAACGLKPAGERYLSQ